MEQTLRLLHKAGYQPRVIIDAGANEGNWTRMAMRFFPNAHIHLIEPQPAYYRTLKLLVKSAGKLTLHPCALTRPGLLSVHMAGAGTGAWVLGEEESTGGTIECPASTLDDLFGRELSSNDRCLLKLDLEGHEWTALQGGVQMLRRVEVIVAEVQFFGNSSDRLFADVLDCVRKSGFEVFDIAALAPRLRDGRLRSGDVVFVRKGTPLAADVAWS
jgi:FkbM family methyltransferase